MPTKNVLCSMRRKMSVPIFCRWHVQRSDGRQSHYFFIASSHTIHVSLSHLQLSISSLSLSFWLLLLLLLLSFYMNNTSALLGTTWRPLGTTGKLHGEHFDNNWELHGQQFISTWNTSGKLGDNFKTTVGQFWDNF